MQIIVVIDPDSLTDTEIKILDFARERFNKNTGQGLDSNDVFLAEYIKSRIIPSFIINQKQSVAQVIKQKVLAKITITGNDKLENLARNIDEAIQKSASIEIESPEGIDMITGEPQ